MNWNSTGAFALQEFNTVILICTDNIQLDSFEIYSIQADGFPIFSRKEKL